MKRWGEEVVGERDGLEAGKGRTGSWGRGKKWGATGDFITEGHFALLVCSCFVWNKIVIIH